MDVAVSGQETAAVRARGFSAFAGWVLVLFFGGRSLGGSLRGGEGRRLFGGPPGVEFGGHGFDAIGFGVGEIFEFEGVLIELIEFGGAWFVGGVGDDDFPAVFDEVTPAEAGAGFS